MDKLKIILENNIEILYIWNPQKSVAYNSERFWGLINKTPLTMEELYDINELWNSYTGMRVKYK